MKIIKVIKQNRSIILIVTILVVGFSVLFYFQNRQNQLIEKLIKVSETTDNAIHEVNTNLLDLSDKVESGDSGPVDLISDYTVVAGEPNFTNLTSELTIEIVPKEFTVGTSAYFYIGDQKIKLEEKDNKYTGLFALYI